MLNVFVADPRGCLVKVEVAPDRPLPAGAVWIDLVSPTANEEHQVEALVGVGVPTREEMQEIEVSSRLYEENGALYMTATVLCKSQSERPESTAISFILTRQRLVTVRYAQPQPFDLFSNGANARPLRIRAAMRCSRGCSKR
jgi:magnesium transporter